MPFIRKLYKFDKCNILLEFYVFNHKNTILSNLNFFTLLNLELVVQFRTKRLIGVLCNKHQPFVAPVSCFRSPQQSALPLK
jgi:hypothetical protein